MPRKKRGEMLIEAGVLDERRLRLALADQRRAQADFDIGLELSREAGAQLTTVEAALFDALVRAGGPEFKVVSAAVK